MATIGTMDIVLRVIDQGTKVLDNVNSALANTKATTNKLGVALGAFAGAFVFREVAGAIRDIGSAMVDISKAGAQYERAMTAFQIMTKLTGEEYTSVLGQMRVAARGTVSDMDLMLNANKALSLGVAQTGAEMAKLIEVSTALGRRTGLGQEQSLERLMVGIGRLSPRILDDLGIAVNLTQVYADATGKLASELTQEEKIQSLLNHVLKEGNEILAQYPQGLDDTASGFERLGAAWDNFKNSLGQTGIFSGLAQGINDISLALNQIDLLRNPEKYSFQEVTAGIQALYKDIELLQSGQVTLMTQVSQDLNAWSTSEKQAINRIKERIEWLEKARLEQAAYAKDMNDAALLQPPAPPAAVDWAAQLKLAGGQILAELPKFKEAREELARLAAGEVVTPESQQASANVQQIQDVLRQLIIDYNTAAEALELDPIDISGTLRTGDLQKEGALAKDIFEIFADGQKAAAAETEAAQKRIAEAMKASNVEYLSAMDTIRNLGESFARDLYPKLGTEVFGKQAELVSRLITQFDSLTANGYTYSQALVIVSANAQTWVQSLEESIAAQNRHGTSTEDMIAPLSLLGEIAGQVSANMQDMANIVGGSALSIRDWARDIDEAFAIADERRARSEDTARRNVFDSVENQLKSQILANTDTFGGTQGALEYFQRMQAFLDTMRQSMADVPMATGELDFLLNEFMSTWTAGLQERSAAVQELESASSRIAAMGQQFAAQLFPEIGTAAFKQADAAIREMLIKFNELVAGGATVQQALIIIENEFGNLTSYALSAADAVNTTTTNVMNAAPPLNTAATAAEFLGLAFGNVGDGGYFAAGGIFAARQEASAAIGPLLGAAQAAIAAKEAMISQAQTRLKTQYLGAIDLFGVEGSLDKYREASDVLGDMTDDLNLSRIRADELEFTLMGMTEASAGGIQNIRDELAETERAAKNVAKDGVSEIEKAAKETEKAFEDLKGKVAGVLDASLDPGVGVDPADFMPRPDAINENARRLADIMVNGFKNQSWLEEFKSEVPDIYQALVDSGDPKTTAAQMLQRFQDGLVPELIDKEVAKERVKQMLLGEKNMDALADEIARELATELGMSLAETQAATSQALGLSVSTGQQATVSAVGLDGTSEGDNFVTGFTIAVTARNAEIANTGAAIGSAWGEAFLASTRSTVPSGLIDVLFKLVNERMASNNSRQGAIQ